jgi:hypothetical protein
MRKKVFVDMKGWQVPPPPPDTYEVEEFSNQVLVLQDMTKELRVLRRCL